LPPGLDPEEGDRGQTALRRPWHDARERLHDGGRPARISARHQRASACGRRARARCSHNHPPVATPGTMIAGAVQPNPVGAKLETVT
jgi:hypothetical protein